MGQQIQLKKGGTAMLTKHETAYQVTASYMEFLVTVLRVLPRDLGPDVVRGWTQNGESLARVLREALMPDGKLVGLPAEASATAGDIYPLSVDYGISVEDALKVCRYEWANSGITSGNFPTNREGVVMVVAEIIHFNRRISSNMALEEIDSRGMRPLELLELLAFGKMYPEVQREFPVVGLGSVQRREGSRYVPYLGKDDSELGVGLSWFEDPWHEICRFAAVGK